MSGENRHRSKRELQRYRGCTLWAVFISSIRPSCGGLWWMAFIPFFQLLPCTCNVLCVRVDIVPFLSWNGKWTQLYSAFPVYWPLKALQTLQITFTPFTHPFIHWWRGFATQSVNTPIRGSLPFTHPSGAIYNKVDTSGWGLEELGIEWLIVWLVDNPEPQLPGKVRWSIVVVSIISPFLNVT